MRYVSRSEIFAVDRSTYPAAASFAATCMMLESNPAFPGHRTYRSRNATVSIACDGSKRGRTSAKCASAGPSCAASALPAAASIAATSVQLRRLHAIPSTVICRPSSVICHLSSVVRRLVDVVVANENHRCAPRDRPVAVIEGHVDLPSLERAGENPETVAAALRIGYESQFRADHRPRSVYDHLLQRLLAELCALRCERLAVFQRRAKLEGRTVRPG